MSKQRTGYHFNDDLAKRQQQEIRQYKQKRRYICNRETISCNLVTKLKTSRYMQYTNTDPGKAIRIRGSDHPLLFAVNSLSKKNVTSSGVENET